MDALPVTSVLKTASTTSSITKNGEEFAKFDLNLGRWIITKPTLASSHNAKSNEPREHLVTGSENKALAIAGNSAKPLSSTNASILSSNSSESRPNIDSQTATYFDQRPSKVYVDEPARLEMNTDDPLYRLPDRVYQATPTIARTGSDRYWMAWRADNKNAKEGPGNFAVLAYSNDGLTSTKEYGYLTYLPEHPDNQIIDPMLWTDPSGRLWLFYGVIGDDKVYDGIGGSWAVICDDPNAKRPVWGKPFRLSYYGVPRRPVKVDEKWYMAVDGWRYSAEEPPKYASHVGPHIYELNWRDRKIKHLAQLPPNNNGQYSGFFETEFVQKSDGNVLALLRSYGGSSQMQYSSSNNLMQTWTPWHTYKVAEPNSSSRSWLGKTPSGRLLLCWNNDLVRKSLTIGLSDDDGITYKNKITVEPNPNLQVSYPVITFGDNGKILVIYDNGRETHKQIRISEINEQEVISGAGSPRVKIISDPSQARSSVK